MTVVVVLGRGRQKIAYTLSLRMCVPSSRSVSLYQIRTFLVSAYGGARRRPPWRLLEITSKYTHFVVASAEAPIAPAALLPAATPSTSLRAAMQSFREMQARDIATGCESGLAALPLGECGETAVAIVAHAASGAPRRLRSRVNLDQASTSASLRSSSSNHAATEDGDEAAGADGGVDVDGGRSHKSCKGCKRVYGKSRNFFAPTEFVQWGFSNGRGNYCADCYITWRTCMSHSHPLGVLESWIYIAEENTELVLCSVDHVEVRRHAASLGERDDQVRVHQVHFSTLVLAVEAERRCLRGVSLPFAAVRGVA